MLMNFLIAPFLGLMTGIFIIKGRSILIAFLSFFLLDVAYEIIYYSTQSVFFDLGNFDVHKLPQAFVFSIFEAVCDIVGFTLLAFIGGMVRVKFIDKNREKFDDSIQH